MLFAPLEKNSCEEILTYYSLDVDDDDDTLLLLFLLLFVPGSTVLDTFLVSNELFEKVSQNTLSSSIFRAHIINSLSLDNGISIINTTNTTTTTTTTTSNDARVDLTFCARTHHHYRVVVVGKKK